MTHAATNGRALRVTIATASLLAVLTAIVASLVLPERAGTLGMQTTRNGGGAAVVRLTPRGPAENVGVRPGDEVPLNRMPFGAQVAFFHPIAGAPMQFPVERHKSVVSLTATPSQQGYSWDHWIILAFTLLYVLVALLVALKAQSTAATAAILAFLIGIATNEAANALADVLPTAHAAAAAQVAAQIIVIAIVLAQFTFPLVFPLRNTRTLRAIALVGAPIAIAYGIVRSWSIISQLLVNANSLSDAFQWLTIAFAVVVTAGVIDCLRSSSREIRSQAAWGAFGILIPVYFFALESTWILLGWDGTFWQQTVVIPYASGLAMAYAVLRHRLGGLELFISRAATFSVVSLVLVAAFVLGEWGIAVILERSIGNRFTAAGQAVLAAFIALAVGLSARSVHEAVSHRLNRLFFARRYRSLEALHRFSLETDSAIDTSAVAKLAVAILERHLDAQYVALYRGLPEDGYTLVHGDDGRAPGHLSADDELGLRLRRWNEAFLNDEPTEYFSGAYICPMTLRGSLRGFIVCGPKRDRAMYLPDEREVLSTLTHRVGIALEWLAHPAELAERAFTLPAPTLSP